MKTKLITCFILFFALANPVFAQKIVYTLNEKMNAGCYGANKLTDFTKKVTITFEAEKANLFFSSVNCKFSEDCSNYGVLNATTGGVLYMNRDMDLGFISEQNEKIIVLRKEGDVVGIIGVAHSDKAKAETVTVANENTVYKNELTNFKSVIARMIQGKKMREINLMAAADSTSTFLNDKEILKDSRGMSGIYYSTTPILLTFDLPNKNMPAPYAKKFLINYDEKPAKPTLTINSQYAYETSDRTKFVRRAIFWIDDYWKNVLDKKGVFASSASDNVDNDKYEFYTHTETFDLQGNSLLGPDRLTNFEGTVYEAEPGILLIVGEMQNTTSFMKDLNYAKRFGVVAVLYKAEKAAQVKKYSNDVAWDKIKELNQKIDGAGYATKETLPVEGMKDAKIKQESFTFAKEDAAKNHPKESVQYTYIAGKEWNIIRDKNSGAILKRSLRIIVVVKIGDQCAFENASIYQNYDGASYGPSNWVPAGAPVYFDCMSLNQYK
jgi:hypothetical protein